jgi:hypothetical protein
VFRLDGVSCAHALPLLSDGDPAIDLGGAATRFVATHADDQREIGSALVSEHSSTESLFASFDP